MIVVSLLIVVLGACGTLDDETDESTNPSDEDIEVDDNEATDELQSDSDVTNSKEESHSDENDKNAKMQKLDFAEFDLELEYHDDKEYEAEIDKSSSGEYKAELKDELTNTHLRGDEAFEQIYSQLEQVTLDKDSSKEEVIDTILQAFELDSDYDEFEVELIFHDGTKLEYEDK